MEWMHGPPDVACPVPVAVVPLGSGTVGVEELPTLPATSVVEMGGVGYVGKALLAHEAPGATLVTAGAGAANYLWPWSLGSHHADKSTVLQSIEHIGHGAILLAWKNLAGRGCWNVKQAEPLNLIIARA